MAKLKPIVDYHGKEIEPEIIFKSTGIFVYFDVGEEFARLTPEQARVRLVRAAAEGEGYAS